MIDQPDQTCANCAADCEIAQQLRAKGCNVSLLTCFAWTQKNRDAQKIEKEEQK